MLLWPVVKVSPYTISSQSGIEAYPEVCIELVDRDAGLAHAVAVADRNRVVVE